MWGGGGGVVVLGSTQLCGHPNFVLGWSWVVTISFLLNRDPPPKMSYTEYISDKNTYAFNTMGIIFYPSSL
jgi:hypothetical protein